MFEHILRCGSDEPQSIERIVAQFAKGKSVEEIAEFLKNEFAGKSGIGHGRGYIYNDDSEHHLSAWFGCDGISFAVGDTAFPVGSRAHIGDRKSVV